MRTVIYGIRCRYTVLANPEYTPRNFIALQQDDGRVSHNITTCTSFPATAHISVAEFQKEKPVGHVNKAVCNAVNSCMCP